MKKYLLFFSLILLIFSNNLFAQAYFGSAGRYNPTGFDPADTLAAWRTDQGCRTVYVADDLDGDGKQEILATDYSNGGRIHVLEMNGDALEIVWSTPKQDFVQANSVPRWVRWGDLDGDGLKEIIFPIGPRYTGELQVWEFDGTDNSYGTEPALTLPADFYIAQLGASSAFRMDREVGEVYDYDGDGLDEVIFANQDNKVYILGVNGDIPGFGGWQLEGGDPTVHPKNRFSGGSWWHSLPADIDGDGTMEIVSHYWNFWGYWGIEPNGTDSYTYPDPQNADDSAKVYYEYMKDIDQDGTAYMGIQAVDVDGDGSHELAGIVYVGGASRDYDLTLMDPKGDNALDTWGNQEDFGFIGEELWTLSGALGGSFWGIGGYDFNGNGKDEIYVGGVSPYNVVGVEYKGTGSLTDPSSYDSWIAFPGDDKQFFNIDYYDSLGTVVDTVFRESPFISKMYSGSDINGNGAKELVASYQSVADSITYTYYKWDTVNESFLVDSSKGVNGKEKLASTDALNIRVMEYTGTTGFRAIDYDVVSPDDYVLEQNYPNPFNPETTIRFSLPLDKQISLVVYDMLGREVKTLLNSEMMKKGAYEVTWDGTNNSNAKVASGNYIYTLKFGNFTKSVKMTLLK